MPLLFPLSGCWLCIHHFYAKGVYGIMASHLYATLGLFSKLVLPETTPTSGSYQLPKSDQSVPGRWCYLDSCAADTDIPESSRLGRPVCPTGFQYISVKSILKSEVDKYSDLLEEADHVICCAHYYLLCGLQAEELFLWIPRKMLMTVESAQNSILGKK